MFNKFIVFLLLSLLYPQIVTANCYKLFKDSELIYENSEPPFSLAYSSEEGYSQEYNESQERGEILQIENTYCTSFLYPGMESDMISSDEGHIETVRIPIKDTCPTSSFVLRDDSGRIARSESSKNEFKSSNPCPSTGLRSGSCPGYIIDHIKPLACGGLDAPCNMQWQTVSDSKEKDKYERDNCEVPTYKTKYIYHINKYYKNNNVNSNLPHDINIGSRGGRFYINANGNKTYIRH